MALGKARLNHFQMTCHLQYLPIKWRSQVPHTFQSYWCNKKISQKGLSWYAKRGANEILLPFSQSLGMCVSWWSRKVPWLYYKETKMDGWILSCLFEGHKQDQRTTQLGSSGILASRYGFGWICQWQQHRTTLWKIFHRVWRIWWSGLNTHSIFPSVLMFLLSTIIVCN